VGKIKSVEHAHLFCREAAAAVSLKIASSCPPNFQTQDTAASWVFLLHFLFFKVSTVGLYVGTQHDRNKLLQKLFIS